MKEPKTDCTPAMPHLLSLSERRSLSVSGVKDVDSFDDNTVIVYTEQGELTVKGSSLHITRLNIETGDLTLEGKVDSLTYAELHTRGGGFFGKLLR